MNRLSLMSLVAGVSALGAVSGTRGQTPTPEDVVVVLRTAVAHTRAEFAPGRLFIDLTYEPLNPPEAGLATPLAEALGASVASMAEVFGCDRAPTGNTTCSGDGVLVIVSRPTIQDADAVVGVHYMFLTPKGRLATVSIKLQLVRSSGAWRVVREIEREYTLAGKRG
ncbi:MAG: hypothetical protein ACRELD_02045 [Longimicrobiales bacterium]